MGGGGGACEPVGVAGLEGVGRVLVLLVGEELLDELVAGVFGGVLDRGGRVASLGIVALFRGWGGDDHAGLDLDEGGGHDEELAGLLDVDVGAELLHEGEVLEVLGGEGGDGDVVEVDLAAFDEVEQEVEGPGVGVELDAIALGG